MKEESDAGKVRYVFWVSNKKTWRLQYIDASGQQQKEIFNPKHFDLPTNSEQMRAAHQDAVVRKKVLEKTGQIQVKTLFLKILYVVWACVFVFLFLFFTAGSEDQGKAKGRVRPEGRTGMLDFLRKNTVMATYTRTNSDAHL